MLLRPEPIPMKEAIYTSQLTKAECLRRLRERTRGRFRGRCAPGTISATVDGDWFCLFAWGPRYFYNSFAPYFYGTIDEAAGQSRIRGRLRMRTLVRTFLWVWFSMLASAECLLLLLPASGWTSGERPSPAALLAPVAIALLGYGLLRYGWWRGRAQALSIEHFLERKLEASPSKRWRIEQRSS